MHGDVHVRPPEHRHRFVRRAHLFTEDRGANLGEPVDDLVDGALVLGQLLSEWRSLDSSIHTILKEKSHGTD